MNDWVELTDKISAIIKRRATLADILLIIGIHESCQAPKINYDTSEKNNLLQMAEQTVLVPALYYKLLWVEDSGWPHYQPIQRPPAMTEEQREAFLRPWVLQYLQRNRRLLDRYMPSPAT